MIGSLVSTGASTVTEFISQNIFGLDDPNWFMYLLCGVIAAVLVLHVIAVGALFFIWAERKIAGRIQDRLGPTRVGGKFGWLQTLADGVKLIAKEDFVPRDADAPLFKIAPYIAFAASFAAFLALPFADGAVAHQVNTAVFFVLAVLGLEVFGVILAGYASGSKWSLFGAMREAAQVVSYEVPLGMCVVIPVFVAGTMNLTTIGEMQAGWFNNWLVFHDPFTFIAAIVYFTCATASVNRAPFDLAEAESELVAGFHTEYSGLRWSFFFMAEYGSMFLVSALASILFFGGWHPPIPIDIWILEAFADPDLVAAGPLKDAVPSLVTFLVMLIGIATLVAKSVIGVVVMMWVRWTFPRLRIDQVMATCLKYCVPIAAVCFVGSMTWETLDLPSMNTINRYEVHEDWSEDLAVSTAGEDEVDPNLPEDENYDDESSDVMDGEEAPIEEDSVAVQNGLLLQEGE